MQTHSNHGHIACRIAAWGGPLLLALVLLLPGGTARAQGGTETASFARHAASGKSLVLPDRIQGLRGRVYQILSGRERQIFFESNAPLEKIKGQSNRVIGYVVVGAGGNPAQILAGEGHLPVTSIKTGIDLRDEHLASKDWLDAAAHPNIVFRFHGARDLRLLKDSPAFRTYQMTVLGDMTIHGVTKELVLPKTTLTFLKESAATRRIARGDLMAVRAKFSVKLKDFGVSHPVIGEKVANEVGIDTVLYLSRVPPEKQ